MIDPVKVWFEITQYDDNRAISITNSVETAWLTSCPIPMTITYDQGSEFIGHEFRKNLTETEYGMISKPRTSGNPNPNRILERIHQVLGNLNLVRN